MSKTMMRAVRYHEYGSPQVLSLEDVPRPEPGKGQVLVRVHAAGVNPVDWKIRQGGWGKPLPATPGLDFAGLVESAGPGVSSPGRGQEIFGVGKGSYAEYALAEADSVAAKPRNLSYDEAATIPMGPAPRGRRSSITPSWRRASGCWSTAPPAGWASGRCSSVAGRGRR